MVAADDRQVQDPRQQPRADARRARASRGARGRSGPRPASRRSPGRLGTPTCRPAVEGDVDLGHRAQAAVDVGVGADHLDLVAGHAALADLLDRVGDAVHPAEAVGDQRDPRPVAVRARQLELLAAEEGRRGGVRDRRRCRRRTARPWRGGRDRRGRLRVGRRARGRPRRACARGSGARGGTGRGG